MLSYNKSMGGAHLKNPNTVTMNQLIIVKFNDEEVGKITNHNVCRHSNKKIVDVDDFYDYYGNDEDGIPLTKEHVEKAIEMLNSNHVKKLMKPLCVVTDLLEYIGEKEFAEKAQKVLNDLCDELHNKDDNDVVCTYLEETRKKIPNFDNEFISTDSEQKILISFKVKVDGRVLDRGIHGDKLKKFSPKKFKEVFDEVLKKLGISCVGKDMYVYIDDFYNAITPIELPKGTSKIVDIVNKCEDMSKLRNQLSRLQVKSLLPILDDWEVPKSYKIAVERLSLCLLLDAEKKANRNRMEDQERNERERDKRDKFIDWSEYAYDDYKYEYADDHYEYSYLPSVVKYANGDISHILNRAIRLNNNGLYLYKNGSKYVGEFSYDKFEGCGNLTWFDGTFYKGNWKEGKKHGHGVETYNDGSRFEGEWVNGEKHGHGTLTNENGKIVNEEWLYDKLQFLIQEERIELFNSLEIM